MLRATALTSAEHSAVAAMLAVAHPWLDPSIGHDPNSASGQQDFLDSGLDEDKASSDGRRVTNVYGERFRGAIPMPGPRNGDSTCVVLGSSRSTAYTDTRCRNSAAKLFLCVTPSPVALCVR